MSLEVENLHVPHRKKTNGIHKDLNKSDVKKINYLKHKLNLANNSKFSEAVDETEVEIENLLFGHQNSSVSGSSKKILNDFSNAENERYLFEDCNNLNEEKKFCYSTEKDVTVRQPVWVDDEDCGESVPIFKEKRLRKLRTSADEKSVPLCEYESRLRSYHDKVLINSIVPKWANLEKHKKSELQLANELLASSASIFKRKDVEILSKKKILLSRINFNYRLYLKKKNINGCFHPKENIIVFTTKKNLYLYEVNKNSCELLHHTSFGNFGINYSCFSINGQELFVTGKNRKIYFYDFESCKLDVINNALDSEHKSYKRVHASPSGKIMALYSHDETVTILDANTKVWLYNLRINYPVQAICFNASGDQLWATGNAGEMFIFDIESRVCIKRFRDVGYSLIRSMKISPDGSYFATGQESGVVNIYRLDEDFYNSASPSPIKSFDNLVTSISDVEFNNDSQILAFCSSEAKNAVRLVHLPSCTVFENWPCQKFNLGYVRQIRFSYDSSYLSTLDYKGKIVIFKLLHYHPHYKHKKA